MDVAAADLLRTYGNPSLQQMLSQRELPHQGLGKQKMVDALARDLYAPKRVQAALAALVGIERAVLDQLILAGGEAPTARFVATLERDGVLEPHQKLPQSPYDWEKRGSPWESGSRKFVDVVSRLGVLGLAFTAEPVGSGGFIVDLPTPGQRLFIPTAILRQLPAVTVEPEQPPAPPTTVHPADPTVVLRDVYTLLSSARGGALLLTSRGVLAKRALVRLDESLRQPENAAQARTEHDLPRLALLRALGEELGLLVPRIGLLALGDAGEAFLARPAGERRAALYGAYARTTRWSELARLPNLGVTRGVPPDFAPPPLGDARRRVLAELAALPADEWLTLDHVVDRLRRWAYEFLFARRSSRYGYGAGYRPNPYYGENPLGLYFPGIADEAKGWEVVEAQLIRLIATGPLHWLGLLDLGGENGAPAVLRITPDGARLLRGEPLAEEAAAPNVVVQPNFQMFAFEPTGEDVLFQLDRLAERMRAEQAVEYRLTRESVYAAQRAGLDSAAILALLDRVSRTPLPQNVRRTLEEWGALHERITMRRGVPLLHAAAGADLDALYADPALAALLGTRLSPTAALVPRAADLPRLADALLGDGHLPALSEGAEEIPAPALAVDAAGHLTFRQRLPSVHVLRAVEPFLDTATDGARSLTTTSLRRAAQHGLSAEDILAVLERYHAGPLPPEVPVLVRRWARVWGAGALVEATLLQVGSAEILADLLADPEIGPNLQALPGAATFALVRPAATARVRAALEARGMALGDELRR
jgi:hypothetical protein